MLQDESQCKGACQEIIDQWIKEKGAKDMRKKNEKGKLLTLNFLKLYGSQVNIKVHKP